MQVSQKLDIPCICIQPSLEAATKVNSIVSATEDVSVGNEGDEYQEVLEKGQDCMEETSTEETGEDKAVEQAEKRDEAEMGAETTDMEEPDWRAQAGIMAEREEGSIDTQELLREVETIDKRVRRKYIGLKKFQTRSNAQI